MRARLVVPVLVIGCLVGGCAHRPDRAPEPTPSPSGGRHDAHHGSHAVEGHHGPHAHAMGDMPHRFEDADAWAEHFDDPARDDWQKPDAVIAELGLAPDASVADIGAGTGYFAVRFARVVPNGRVYAQDIEPDMIRYLRQRAEREGLQNVIAVEATPADPALPESVDVIFMCDVYHHIADRTPYFERLAQRLRPGGRIVIVDFEVDAPPDTPGPPRRHRVSPDRVAAELRPAGLTLARENRELLPYQYVLEFRRGE